MLSNIIVDADLAHVLEQVEFPMGYIHVVSALT